MLLYDSKIDDSEKNSFGHTLKKLRESRYVSKAKMAKLLNVSPSTYACYENGSTNPSPYRLKLIANFFNISIAELLDYKTNEFDYYKNFWELNGCEVEGNDNDGSVSLKLLENTTPTFKNGVVTFDTDTKNSVTFGSSNDFIVFTKSVKEKIDVEITKIQKSFCEQAIMDLAERKNLNR